MKTIGLIGGMSWESTRLYYALLNETVRTRLGGLHSADILLRSVDFAPVAAMQAAGEWEAAGRFLADVARGLEAAGAGVIGLATNTMHKVAPAITAAIGVPFVHIAEPTAEALIGDGRRRPLLLATRFTMEEAFYLGLLRDKGLGPVVPDAAGRAEVHRVIYEELCRGVVQAASRRTYEALIETAARNGADSVILGCTEVCLLIGAENSALPVYDTTALHVEALIDAALG
ncbi:MAG: aspartate/glutamate racemase family protein [Hyphomicrobiaceae bacterium]